jgi:hypothetical protein
MAIRRTWQVYCVTEGQHVSDVVLASDPDPTTCPNDAGHTVGTIFIESTDHKATVPTDPTADDDTSRGYEVGDRWVNSSSHAEFLCVDDTDGAAVWTSTTAGSNAGDVEGLSEKTTTATAPRDAETTLNTGTIPAGRYRVGWAFEWNLTSTRRKFIARIQRDDTEDLFNITREPKDASDWHSESSFAHVTLSAGTHVFDLDYQTDANGATAKVRNVRFEFWKV